jgi:hypothetical protein
MAGSIGGALGVVYSRTEKNNQIILEIVREQGRIEERQKYIEKYQDVRIVQLIDALRNRGE